MTERLDPFTDRPAPWIAGTIPPPRAWPDMSYAQASAALDAEIRSVSSTGGEKGTKVFRYDLIPGWPLRMLAKLYGVGARKYAERNWERGYEWSKSFAALNRHLWAWWGGEDRDPETDIPHLTCVAWHAFALAEFSVSHPEFDDRPGTLERKAE